MDLFALNFPVTIVAPDGWASRLRDVEASRVWSTTAIEKYRRVGFIVADADGTVWQLADISAETPVPAWKNVCARVWSFHIRTRIEVAKVAPDPLASFRKAILKALEKDDDSLAQLHSREEIAGIVASAESVPALISRLCRMGVIASE